MLVLERTIDESIIICENGEIKITVLEVKGGQVKLGIEAPKRIMVHRKEIYERLKNNNLPLKDVFIQKNMKREFK